MTGPEFWYVAAPMFAAGWATCAAVARKRALDDPRRDWDRLARRRAHGAAGGR